MSYNYKDQVQEPEEQLHRLKRNSKHILVFQRLQMLHLFKSGNAGSLSEAAALIGVSVKSTQTWWKLYLRQGIEKLQRVKPTRQIRLSIKEQEALLSEAAKGNFSTINDMARWVKAQFGISYTEVGMWRIARRLGIRKKTARPRHVLKDEQKAASFKKASPSW